MQQSVNRYFLAVNFKGLMCPALLVQAQVNQEGEQPCPVHRAG